MPRALILVPQRRSIVSSNPITTGASVGTKALTNKISSWRAAARDDCAVEDAMEVTQVGIAFAPEDAERGRNGSPARRQDGAGEQ